LAVLIANSSRGLAWASTFRRLIIRDRFAHAAFRYDEGSIGQGLVLS